MGFRPLREVTLVLDYFRAANGAMGLPGGRVAHHSSLMNRAPRSLAVAFGTLVLAASVAATLSAHPSGGPYGPMQRHYEVPSAPHVYYVAPNGSATSAGTSLQQPTTLETAVDKVTTGDAIILRGGEYRTGDLRLNQGVTIQPYGDEHPILKGTEIAAHWEALPNKRWRTHWTKLFPAKPADWWQPEHHLHETPLVLFNNDMVFVDGELLGAVATVDEVTDKTYFVDYANAQITIGRDPKDHVVEITAHDSALVRTFRDVHGKTNDRQGPTIRGIVFTEYAYRALEVEGIEPQKYSDPATFGKEVVGTTLEDLTISFCSRVAGYFRGDKFTMRNCLVADCGTEGIYVINSSDVLLERNVVTRTNTAEKFQGYFASAVKIFNQSYRAVIRDNVIIDNPYASGVWFDVGEVDAVFVDNWVERTDSGFFFEISKGATCAGNVFVECNPGTRVLNSSKVQVYQNTYYNSQASFGRYERSAVNDHFGWHPSAGPDVEERHSHVFVNNLLVADGTYREPLVQFWQSEAVRERLKNPQVSGMDGNVYVRRIAGTPAPAISWGPVENAKQSIDIFALADLRKLHPEFEAHSVALANYWSPVFRSPQLHRFEVVPEFAPAKGGVPLPDRIRTLLRLPAGAAPFVGAYPAW